jgi:hypothetical protein
MQIEEKACEISRLSIRQDFRGTRDINKALYFAAFAVVKISGVQSVFALMEPRLSQYIKRTGFAFSQVSETCDLMGNRGIFVYPVGASPVSLLSTEIEATVKVQLAAAWIRDSLRAIASAISS